MRETSKSWPAARRWPAGRSDSRWHRQRRDAISAERCLGEAWHSVGLRRVRGDGGAVMAVLPAERRLACDAFFPSRRRRANCRPAIRPACSRPWRHGRIASGGSGDSKLLVGQSKSPAGAAQRLRRLEWSDRTLEDRFARSMTRKARDCICLRAERSSNFSRPRRQSDDAPASAGEMRCRFGRGAARCDRSSPRLAGKLADGGAGSADAVSASVRSARATGDLRLTVFPDGRVIVHGTADPERARSIYARFVGALSLRNRKSYNALI